MGRKRSLLWTLVVMAMLMIGMTAMPVFAEGEVPEGAITNFDERLSQRLCVMGFDENNDGYITVDELNGGIARWGGSLNLTYYELTKLDGLENITVPLGRLSLNNNDITDLTPIKDVKTNSLYLYSNPNLADITPLYGNDYEILDVMDTAVTDDMRLQFMDIPTDGASSGVYVKALAPGQLFSDEEIKAAIPTVSDDCEDVDVSILDISRLTIQVDATNLKEDKDVHITFSVLGQEYSMTVHMKTVANDIVNIPDENLLAALTFCAGKQESDATKPGPIATVIDANWDGKITHSELEAVESLNMNLYGYPVSDFTGLEAATNLKYLAIKDNKPEKGMNLSALSGMPQLEGLTVSDTNLKDISFVKNLENLSNVFIVNSDITDATPVAGMTNLKILNLYNNKIAKCPDLSALTNLVVQEKGAIKQIFTNNLIPASEFTANKFAAGVWDEITKIGQEKWIKANAYDGSEVKVPDAVLKEALDSDQDGKVTKSEALSVTNLYLAHKDLTDLTGLETAENLEQLNISGTKVADLTPIANLTELRDLDATNCTLTDIPDLTALSKLSVYTVGPGISKPIKMFSGNAGLTVGKITADKFAESIRVFITEEWIDKNSYDGTIVTFGSQKVKQQLLDYGFDTDRDGEINKSELMELDYLQLDLNNGQESEEISFKGFEHAKYLETLYIYNANGVKDIAALQDLRNLHGLSLWWSKVQDSDLDVIGQITSLTSLNVYESDVTNLDALKSLTNLISLQVSNSKITNADAVANLTNLRCLNLVNNQLTTICSLKNLTELDVSDNGPNDGVNPFAGNKIPRSVMVDEAGHNLILSDSTIERANWSAERWEQWYDENTYDNSRVLIKDEQLRECISSNYQQIVFDKEGYTEVGSLTQIYYLSARGKTITTLEGLGKAKNLYGITLSQPDLPDWGDVKKESISSLQLDNLNNVTDIEFIKQFPNLSRLEISSVILRDLTPLWDMNSLTYLMLNSCGIKDASVIGNLTGMKDLRLYNNKIQDLSFVKNLKQLDSLYLSSNLITDLTPIAGLTNLTYLQVQENSLKTLPDLTALSNLKAYYDGQNGVINMFGGNMITKEEVQAKMPVGFVCTLQDDWYEENVYTALEMGKGFVLDSIYAYGQGSGPMEFVEGEELVPSYLVHVTADFRNQATGEMKSQRVYDYDFTLKRPLTPDDTKAEITYTYAGVTKTTSLGIHVERLGISEVEMTTPPTKTDYIEGQIFDSAGTQFTVYYTDGTTKLLANAGGSVTVENAPVKLIAGTNTVTYKISIPSHLYTKDYKYTVNASERKITKIGIQSNPTKTEYVEGQDFDKAGLVLQVTYNDALVETVTADKVTVADGTALKLGTKSVTVTYGGQSIACPITVVKKAVNEIVVKTPPTKTDYVEGQTFDPTGLVVEQKTNAGTTEKFTGTLSYSDKPLTVGANQTFTITANYTDQDPVTFHVNINVVKRVVEKLAVKTSPANHEFVAGQIFDPTGWVFEATYNDKETEEVTAAMVTIDETPLTEGQTTTTVTFGGKTVSVDIKVVKKQLDSITVAEGYKSSYIEGQKFDTTGMVVTAHYNDKTQKTVTSYTVKPDGALTTTDKSVTVTYRDTSESAAKSVAIAVQVREKKLEKIEILSNPTTTEYVEGQDFDVTGLTVKATYDNETTETVAANDLIISGGNQIPFGTTYVTVGYKGKTTTCPITVIKKVAQSIVVETQPTKTTYVAGQAFDPTGMVLKQKTNAGTTEDFNGTLEYSKDPLTTVGESVPFTIHAVYEDGLKLTFTVTLQVVEKVVEKLEITTPPTKVEYVEGQPIDTAGMVVTATYNDGEVKTVTEYTLSTKTTSLGQKAFTVTFGGKSAEQAITVVKKEVTSLTVTPPKKTAYIEKQAFDPDGMVVTAHYNDETSAVVEDYTYQPNGGLAVTNTVVQIDYTYEGKTVSAEVAISVKERSLTDIYVATPPTKTEYFAGEDFDRNGMVVKGIYDNGEEVTITGYQCMPERILTAANQEVAISYQRFTATLPIYVRPKELVGLEEVKAPEYEAFIEGDMFSAKGMVLKAVYDDGSQRLLGSNEWTCALTGEPAADIDPEQPAVAVYSLRGAADTTIVTQDKKSAVYSFGGKILAKGITVIGKTAVPDNLEVKREAVNTQYTADTTKFDDKGMVVEAVFGDVKVKLPEYTCTQITWDKDEKAGAVEVIYNGVKKEQPIKLLDHEHHYVEDTANTKAATCTEAGENVMVCNFDGCTSTIYEEIEPLNHDYTDTKVEATCVSGGYTQHDCSRCDAADYKDGEVKALGHEYATTVHEPTCTADGYTEHTCIRGDDSYNDTVVTALGHDYKPVVTAPTCTEQGYTTYTCERCNDSYVADYVAALGHDYKDEVVAATCLAGGYTKHTCTRCHNSYNDTETSALGHSWDAGKVVAPTCTTGGYTIYTCTRCGVTEQRNASAATGHKFGDWIVSKQPTTGAEGSQYRECPYCGIRETQSIAKKTSGTWKQNSKGWWYEEAGGYYYTNTFLTIKGQVYYFDGSGYMVTGWKKVNNTWYYFNKSGAMVRGWVKSGATWYYLNDDGSMATGLIAVKGVGYYLNGSGAMQTGWKLVGGTWYYFNASGAMRTGWLQSGGTWYYLNGDGKMATGLITVKGVKYYMNGSGAMQTGWKQIGGTWYYFNGSGAMRTGWLQSGGTWYYLNGDGKMATGWITVKGVKYYMNGSGAMQTGWKKLGGKWYYFKASGAMATGWIKPGATWYYLDESGIMAENTWVGNYYVNASGAWTTSR